MKYEEFNECTYIRLFLTSRESEGSFQLAQFRSVKRQNQFSVLEIDSLGSIRLVTMNLPSSLFNNAHLTAAMAVFRAKR